MRYRKPIASFLIILAIEVVLVSSGFAQSIVEAAPGEHPGPVAREQASAWLMIEGDPRLLGTVEPMLPASGIEEVARQAGYGCEFICIPSVVQGRVVVKLKVYQAESVVNEFPVTLWPTMADQLQRFLDTVAAPRPDDVKQFAQARQRAEQSEQEVGALRQELRSLKCYLIQRGGGISPEGLGRQCRELQNQKMMIQVESAGLRARRKAVATHVATTQQSMEKNTLQSNEELKELEHMCANCEVQLKRIKAIHERGVITAEAVRDAENKLSSARAQLERRRHELENDAIGPDRERLAGLTHQLTEIEIETATIEARLETIDKMLAALKPEQIQEIAGKMEEVSGRLEQALDDRAAARKQLARLEEQGAALRPPKVTLLDKLSSDRTDPYSAKPKDTPAEK